MEQLHIYIYIYTVDIQGLLGFIFRGVHNKFHPGLFSIVYSLSFFRHLSKVAKIYFVIGTQITGGFDHISDIQFTSTQIINNELSKYAYLGIRSFFVCPLIANSLTLLVISLIANTLIF